MISAQRSAPTLSAKKIRGDMRVSRERMGRLMSVSAKTIERWEARDALPENEAKRDQLARIEQIRALGLSVYTAEGFAQFLQTPLPAFEGQNALQLIERGRADIVLGALAADYEGLGY